MRTVGVVMTNHRDPVCGKSLNVNKAHIVLIHKGEKYYLCCPVCQREFEKNPEKYILKKPTR